MWFMSHMIHMIHTHKIVDDIFGTNVDKHTEVGHIFGSNSWAHVGIHKHICYITSMFISVYATIQMNAALRVQPARLPI